MSTSGTVVQFGAGNIGRGFMGDLFTAAGCEVVFVDVDRPLLDALNREGAYPLQLVGPTRFERRRIAPVRALHASDVDGVARELARCRLACTAVGVGVLPRVAPVLAAGIRLRSTPLDVILCENQLDCSRLLRNELASCLTAAELERVGLVESVVSRMAPVVPPEVRAAEPLLAIAEDYARLPVDASGFRAEIPAIPGLIPVSDFPAWVERKLFVHNLGHAAAAYLGAAAGLEYVHEAMQSASIRACSAECMAEASEGLARKHGSDRSELAAHREDLLRRFANEHMRDTLARVARDPVRKLRPDDRLSGAAALCLAHGVQMKAIPRALGAALAYRAGDDPSASEVEAMIRRLGAAPAFRELTGLRDPGVQAAALAAYAELTRG